MFGAGMKATRGHRSRRSPSGRPVASRLTALLVNRCCGGGGGGPKKQKGRYRTWVALPRRLKMSATQRRTSSIDLSSGSRKSFRATRIPRIARMMQVEDVAGLLIHRRPILNYYVKRLWVRVCDYTCSVRLKVEQNNLRIGGCCNGSGDAKFDKALFFLKVSCREQTGRPLEEFQRSVSDRLWHEAEVQNSSLHRQEWPSCGPSTNGNQRQLP
jgi:hypothetical protein